MNDNTCDDVPAKADAIKLSPFGSELDDTQSELLASVMTSCSIKDRQSGGGDLVGLHILRAGDIMGELGFLDGVEHSASLRAMGNCELLRLERTSLEGLLDKDPDLVYKVMRAIVRTVHRILRNMNAQQVELTNYITKQHGRY